MTHRQLKRIRRQLDLSQRGFGILLGFSGSNAYSRVERGERAVSPTVARLARIAEAVSKPDATVEDVQAILDGRGRL